MPKMRSTSALTTRRFSFGLALFSMLHKRKDFLPDGGNRFQKTSHGDSFCKKYAIYTHAGGYVYLISCDHFYCFHRRQGEFEKALPSGTSKRYDRRDRIPNRSRTIAFTREKPSRKCRPVTAQEQVHGTRFFSKVADIGSGFTISCEYSSDVLCVVVFTIRSKPLSLAARLTIAPIPHPVRTAALLCKRPASQGFCKLSRSKILHIKKCVFS